MDLAKSAKDKPVFFDIKKGKIGVVESGEYQEGKVTITAKIDLDEDLLNKKLFMVPGGLVDYQKNGTVVMRCKAIQYSLTENPGDATLTPIEIIEE